MSEFDPWGSYLGFRVSPNARGLSRAERIVKLGRFLHVSLPELLNTWGLGLIGFEALCKGTRLDSSCLDMSFKSRWFQKKEGSFDGFEFQGVMEISSIRQMQ